MGHSTKKPSPVVVALHRIASSAIWCGSSHLQHDGTEILLRCHLQAVWSQSSQIPRDFSRTDLGQKHTPKADPTWSSEFRYSTSAEVERVTDQTSLRWWAMVYQKRRFRVSVELSLTCTADLRMGCTPGCCENWQLTSSDLGDIYSDRLIELNPFWFWLLTNYHLMSTTGGQHHSTGHQTQESDVQLPGRLQLPQTHTLGH